MSISDLHYDAVLLSGPINGMAELHNARREEETTCCMEISVRLSRILAENLDRMNSAGKEVDHEAA